MLALLIVFLALLLFMGAGAHVVFLPAVIGATLFIGFWVMVLKLSIGFGRWLMNAPAQQPRTFGAEQRRPLRPKRVATVSRTCGDPRCGRVNVNEARYCAQCGRPLGQAA